MLTQLRSGLTAALVILSSYSACAADKSYHRDDLADAAIRLEGQIKSDAGPVTKPLATLRREADAAFARADQRAGVQVLGQIVAVAPAGVPPPTRPPGATPPVPPRGLQPPGRLHPA